jgi:hypothetical protein
MRGTYQLTAIRRMTIATLVIPGCGQRHDAGELGVLNIVRVYGFAVRPAGHIVKGSP